MKKWLAEFLKDYIHGTMNKLCMNFLKVAIMLKKQLRGTAQKERHLRRWQHGQKKNAETLKTRFGFMEKTFISYRKTRASRLGRLGHRRAGGCHRPASPPGKALLGQARGDRQTAG